MIDDRATLYADRPAFVQADEQITYRELAARKNQYARWALARGIRPGEVVCIMMLNCADYIALWLGLTQVGAVAALINTALTGDSLLHALQLCPTEHVVADETCAAAINRIRGKLPRDVRLWAAGAAMVGAGWQILDPRALRSDALAGPESVAVTGSQPALLLFTSGTTGLPKAAPLTHYRVLEWCLWFAGLMGAGPHDQLYDCLPMYHATGGVASCGAMLLSGGAVVIRRKFSMSMFWADIEEQGCTIFLYIGELCRYLLQARPVTSPPPPHRLRLCCGNGLQADIWVQFQKRFAIPRVLEFYASTEGNVSLYNCEARPGALGRLPPFLAHRSPVLLVACDPETGDLLRGQDGLCQPCPPGLPGEALGRISTTDATHSFEGYTDPAATARKIARDVLAYGDSWFRTGDLMRRDGDGYYYFVDRLGETFRWKGENVATTQVAQTILACPGITGAVVYPVRIPGHDGRAGMAAITANPGFDLEVLSAHVARELPAYAQPVFLRVCETLQTTETHKPIKSRLAAEGFDIDGTVYLRDRPTGSYIVLDKKARALVRSENLLF